MKKRKLIFGMAGGVILLLVVTFVILFVVNKWRIEIDIIGKESEQTEFGSLYKDKSARAYLYGTIFNRGGKIIKVNSKGKVDTDKPGDYEITYTAEAKGIKASRVRKIKVVDTVPPVIVLNRIEGYFTRPVDPYTEEGFTAYDNYDGDVSSQVKTEEKDGKVFYTVTDSSGNVAHAERTIVYNDVTPPVITLKYKTMTLYVGEQYAEPGFKAKDDCDGDITTKVTVEGSVDTAVVGEYELKYKVSDTFGNEAVAVRKVSIIEAPTEDKGPTGAVGGAIMQAPQIETVNPGDKVIYLTFDDGPGEYTQQLLDILAMYNVKVTFFVTASKYQNLIAAEAEAGHTVAIHTASHDYKYIYSSEDAYLSDFNEMNNIIYNQTGHYSSLFRFPGGSSNRVSAFNPGIISRLSIQMQEMGYQYFDWNVSSGDAGGTTDTNQVVANVIDGVSKHNVSVVLQHDIKGFSVNAVEEIIVWGLQNGYKFLPLSQNSPIVHHAISN